jgi:nucleoside-diphosphate-sugar epimerase
MKILFTGISSFTGFWFAEELSSKGHEVIATLTKNSPDEYEGSRKERISLILDKVIPVFGSRFGDAAFNEIIESGIDVLCHHGSEVNDYKSMKFDITNAVKQNTNNIIGVIEHLKKNKCNSIVYTGSLFELNEGSGTEPLRAFSPYGLSKSLTYEILRYYCSAYEINLGKFVIPNPFGPFEEARFTNYLIQNWFNGKIPEVKTPDYIRDNIHVNLLALAYEEFVQKVFCENNKVSKTNPSLYAESQGAFTRRLAHEMESRLNIKCDYKLLQQTDFSEPLERINTDCISDVFNWSEPEAWDLLADYYTIKYSNRA